MANDTYLNNITSEHRDKPNFMGWLSKNLEKVDAIYILLKAMDSNFDIDNAIGKQLDTLGTIIGRNRILTFQPLNGFSPVMDDDTYRLVLKAKIAMNNWDGTIPQIYEIWSNIFDDIQLQIEDHQDMTFTAYITGYVNQIRQDLIQQGYIVPKPEGVGVIYVGRSAVPFGVYSGMMASSTQSATITMSYNPVESISFKQYTNMMVQGISTTVLKVNPKGGN
jgi:hypothetical protein